MELIWVAVGGALGSLLRFFLNKFISDSLGNFFPMGVLVINVVGSFVIGLSAGFLNSPKNEMFSDWLVPLVMIGICGGFTTFSSFSLQTWQLFQAGEWFRAGLNIVLSVVLCIAATATGYWLTAPTRV